VSTPAQPAILGGSAEWLVIDKPAGWHSVALRTSDGAPTIEEWLAAAHPTQSTLSESGLVQRLDRWTSGCMLAGRSADAVELLRCRVSSGAGLRKTYLALVTPGLAAQGTWTLHFTSRHRGSERVTVGRRGEERSRGECRWALLSAADSAARRRTLADTAPPAVGPARGAAPRGRGEPAAAFDLLEVELVGAGRRHQIRAGFAFLGHPLAGDGLYGGPALEAEVDEGILHDRPALHAHRIEVDGVRVESPPPWWAMAIAAPEGASR
jgi:23S rRNA pseudouridine1911/1915/1917 synthase